MSECSYMRLHCSTKTYHYPSESLFTGALFTPPSTIVSTNNGTGIYRCDRLEVAWPSECSIQWIGTGMAIMLTITWGQWQSSDHHYITLTTPVDPWGHPCPVNHAKKYAMHTSEDTTGRKRHAWIRYPWNHTCPSLCIIGLHIYDILAIPSTHPDKPLSESSTIRGYTHTHTHTHTHARIPRFDTVHVICVLSQIAGISIWCANKWNTPVSVPATL